MCGEKESFRDPKHLTHGDVRDAIKECQSDVASKAKRTTNEMQFLKDYVH